MALSDKNIVITPNIGQSADPTIVFSGADSTTSAQNIALSVYPASNGTLSFDGSAGQLFSITNSLTGSIFSVNDISGIPSIEVLDTGAVKLAQYGGNVGIGTSSPAYKLDVAGTANVTSLSTSSIVSSNTDITLSATGTGVPKLAVANGVVFTATDHPFSTGGSIVNYPRAFGSQTGYTVGMMAQGSDTNVGLVLSSKGTQSVEFWTNSVTDRQFRVSHTASAVNYVQVTGSATGFQPVISVQGSDTNNGIAFSAKGSGRFDFYSGGLDGRNFSISHTASAVNFLQATGASTNNEPTLSAQGTDTNIALALQSKGAGAIDLATGSGGVNISNGTTVTSIARSAPGSNYTSAPAVTISPPTTSAGVQATATVSIGFPLVNIVSGGSGYSVNDVLTIVGGTYTSAGYVTVTSVSSGVITGVSIGGGYGAYSVAPTNPVSVTGGTGNSATFNLTGWTINSTFNITNAGSGYIEQPTVTFSGGGGSGAAAYATIGSVTRINTLGSQLDFYTPAGLMSTVLNNGGNSIVKSISPSGYAAFQISAASGENAYIFGYSGGSATGRITFEPSNAIAFSSSSGANQQFRISHTASAVNYIQTTGSATNNPVAVWAQGSDSNIRFNISSKGTESVDILTNNTGTRAARFTYTASSVNWVQMTGAVAGASPSYSVAGSDTNIGLDLITKGTGSVKIKTGANSNTQFSVANVDSAVNYVQVTGSATGFQPVISVQGSDTNNGIAFSAKGSGRFDFYSGGLDGRNFSISHTASAVNFLQATGASTNNEPTLSAQGTDTNISIALTPKGSGNVRIAGTLMISSNTLVANLNSDLLDGQSGSYYLNAGNLTGTINTSVLVAGTPSQNELLTYNETANSWANTLPQDNNNLIAMSMIF